MPRKKTPVPDDLTGHRRRNWLVIGPVPDTLNTRWRCLCVTCGAETRTYPRSRLIGAGGRLHSCTAGKDLSDPHKDAYAALGPALDC